MLGVRREGQSATSIKRKIKQGVVLFRCFPTAYTPPQSCVFIIQEATWKHYSLSEITRVTTTITTVLYVDQSMFHDLGIKQNIKQ